MTIYAGDRHTHTATVRDLRLYISLPMQPQDTAPQPHYSGLEGTHPPMPSPIDLSWGQGSHTVPQTRQPKHSLDNLFPQSPPSGLKDWPWQPFQARAECKEMPCSSAHSAGQPTNPALCTQITFTQTLSRHTNPAAVHTCFLHHIYTQTGKRNAWKF